MVMDPCGIRNSLHDALGSADILVISETHESPVHPLPGITGYQWLSVFREEVRTSRGVRGSGGVACLIKDDIFGRTSIVHFDSFAKFMWVRIDHKGYHQRDIYLAACYFPPTASHYAIHGTEDSDPFFDLCETFSQFAALGDIIILGDFNARTKTLQTPLYDRCSDSICSNEIDPTSLGLHRLFEDVLGPLSVYGRHFLWLCESSDLVILNGLSCFPGSELFTCWPHGGGASVVDYILAHLSFISCIHSFTIRRLPLADHSLLSIHCSLSPLSASSLMSPLHSSITALFPIRFHFIEGDCELFSAHLFRLLSPSDFSDSSETTSFMFDFLTLAILDSATLSIPHYPPLLLHSK